MIASFVLMLDLFAKGAAWRGLTNDDRSTQPLFLGRAHKALRVTRSNSATVAGRG
jgi:hypothetical protein